MSTEQAAPSRYAIKPIDTAKKNIPQRACQKEGVLPRFPFSMMMSGRSGSGKTNLLVNVLTRDELLGRYFHCIVVFSPTAGKYDDMYASLNLPEENFREEFGPDQLDEIIRLRKRQIDEDGIEKVAKNCRMLIILDDIIANRTFLESPAALKMFALLRHYLVSVIVLIQSYNKLPRALRLNVNALAVFPATQSEVSVLLDEITPAGLSKRDFERVIDDATSEKHSFLYINHHAEAGARIRKNLDQVIDLARYRST